MNAHVPTPTDYFAFFGLPVAPTVDTAVLKRRFYELSKEYHPDFYTLAPAERQAEILELSTRNNEAYRTLSDDDRRLKYFLECKGVLADEGQNRVPQDFLLDMMDINEALMELEFEPDPAAQQRVSAQVDALAQQLDATVAPTFATYDDALATEEELLTLRDYYLKKRYLLRIYENLATFADR